MSGDIDYAYVDIAAPTAQVPLRRLLRNRNRTVFCLNDTYADEAGHDRAERHGEWFLNAYFPVPSTFERPEATDLRAAIRG